MPTQDRRGHTRRMRTRDRRSLYIPGTGDSGVGAPGAKEEESWGEPKLWGPRDPGSDSGSVTKACDLEQVTLCLSLRVLFTESLSRLKETVSI